MTLKQRALNHSAGGSETLEVYDQGDIQPAVHSAPHDTWFYPRDIENDRGSGFGCVTATLSLASPWRQHWRAMILTTYGLARMSLRSSPTLFTMPLRSTSIERRVRPTVPLPTLATNYGKNATADAARFSGNWTSHGHEAPATNAWSNSCGISVIQSI